MRNLSRREMFLLGLSCILSLFLLTGGELADVSAKENTDPEIFKELKAFTDVISIVRKDYVREVEGKELVEGAIKGMLSTLDPHSGYLDPDFYKDLQVQTKGEFGGLGIEITIKDGLLVVVAPMEDSPAAKAGIRAGDAIVKIEGKYTKDFSLVDAVKRLRGPRGEPITISIIREGLEQPLDVKIVRDRIKVKSIKSRYLEDGFGYVRISQFMERTSHDLKKALGSLKSNSEDQQLRGLILDMRNNPGGLLTQAVRVGDMFLSEGVIVYTEGRVDEQKQKFYAHRQGTEPRYPIIVLVNGGSASASEIVAGAVKDHGRGLVLGTQTFGKGSVQTITPLRNGGALTLTTALYFTKSGRSIQAEGVVPDVEIEPLKLSDIAKAAEEKPAKKKSRADRMREADLPGAIKNPAGKKGKKKKSADDDPSAMRKINKVAPERGDLTRIDPETTPLEDWLEVDIQLARAFDLLKTYNIFKGAETLTEIDAKKAMEASKNL